MKKLTLAMLISGSMMLSGCVIHVGGGKSGNVDGVFGNIQVDEYASMQSLSMVNGNIEMDDHSSAKRVSTVNGNIELGKDVSIISADTVNGSIEADEGLKVNSDLSTVNGDIRLDKQADVGHNIITVNGTIKLEDTRVGGRLESQNGDITLQGQSHVQGDILFVRKHGKKSWWDRNNTPTLKIAANVRVDGEIILDRPVELEIENPALRDKVVRRYGQ